MGELMKIRDISTSHGVTARTLRYYEDMGLLTSVRGEDYAYRMYDEAAVKRLEQILVLRKLSIPVRDIKRIFDTRGSEVVLEVLNRKVEDIDEETALLHELRGIVLEFIEQIRSTDFKNGDSVRLLYEKAAGLENQIVNVDYEGKHADYSRLSEISAKLKKAPEVRVVRLPKCRVATSGEPDFTFEKVWSFDSWWGEYDKKRRLPYIAPPDFLFAVNGGLVWQLVVENDATKEDCGGYDVIDFEGGLYAVHTSVDTDDESQSIVYNKILKWLDTTNFELDDSHPEKSYMGHMINPDDEIKQGLGYHQYEIFVPIRLKKS